MATRAVRWNPEVLEPSITSLRMKWISSTGLAPSSAATVRTTSTASGLARWGGSSSASTRQLADGGAWYRKRIRRSAWTSAARSISPSSDWVGLKRRWNDAPSSSTRQEGQSQNSFRVSSCWWISMPTVTSWLIASSSCRRSRPSGSRSSACRPLPRSRSGRAPTSA